MHGMEDVSWEAIGEKGTELGNTKRIADWIAAIDTFVATGQPEYFYLIDDQQLRDFCKLVGHETVASDQVLAYYYSASANEYCEEYGQELNFEGRVAVPEIQERLGDKGINLEFPNDFRVKLAVALDAETMVVYERESNAEPHVCDDCANSTDPDIVSSLEINRGNYGCGHEDETYDIRNSAMLMARDSASDTLGKLIHHF